MPLHSQDHMPGAPCTAPDPPWRIKRRREVVAAAYLKLCGEEGSIVQ
jgi:hypothetical protein